MSQDAREELKDIARQFRRWLERERWSGRGEMAVADGAALPPMRAVDGGARPASTRAAVRVPQAAAAGAAHSRDANRGPRPATYAAMPAYAPAAPAASAVSAPSSASPVTTPASAPSSASPVTTAASAPSSASTTAVPAYAPGASAPPVPAMIAEAVALPDDWEPVTVSASRGAPRAAPAPAPAAAPAAVVTPPGPAVSDVNLFGDRVERGAPAASGGGEIVEEPLPLPPVHPPLAPVGAARVEVVSASLPVLEEVAGAARACEKCGLCKTRTKAVPGVGSAASGIVFVGEAPGADEDAQGEPFVGRAGQLLTSMIQAMDEKQLIPGVKLDRSTVYICNVLKCRPPENRNPLPHEIEQCSPYLRRQLEALQPRVICCLGKFAAELLTGVKSSSLTAMREKTYRYLSAKLIVTYHPAALLRNPNWKRPAWEDLQRLAREFQTD